MMCKKLPTTSLMILALALLLPLLQACSAATVQADPQGNQRLTAPELQASASR